MPSPSGTNYTTVSISGAWRQKDVGSAKRMYRWQRWTNNAVGAKAWSIVGSNDQTTWYLVDRISNQNTNNHTINVTVNSNYSQYSYRYYRWIEEAMVSGTPYILNHYFGWYDENNSFLTTDQSFSTSSGSGDVTPGGNSSTVFNVNFNTYNWQQSNNYGSTGVYTGSTVMVVYDPTSPQAGPPSAPTSLSASAGDQSVSYTACNPDVTSSPVVISGLTNGQSYNIKLLAVNVNGDGAPSNTITATPHTIPDAPTNLIASYNGSGSVSISFTPGSNGGDTISNYQYSIDAGATFTPLNPVDGITPVTIDGLTNGQTYIIELKAVNSVGAGIASSSVEYTASGLPDVPTSLTWVDSYNGNITVSFTPGSNQGSTITNYLYSLDNGNTYTAFSPPQTGSSVYITGLTNRTQYNIELKAVNANGQSTTSAPLALYYMCFLEGTKILCYDSVANQEVERSIESLRSGDLVKTTMDGYKAIDTIGTSKIYNPANSMRSKNRLYKYSKENHPELKEDLVITGCHAVLVSDLSEEERSDLIDIQGKVYVTADYYRLIACVDKRAQPYEKEGLFNIWHLALENDNYYFNYGIYANGLKVETASKRMMKEMSGMDLVQ